MHYIRHAEAFNLVRQDLNFVLLAFSRDNEWVKTYHFGPWASPNFFWPAMRFELCIPDLKP